MVLMTKSPIQIEEAKGWLMGEGRRRPPLTHVRFSNKKTVC